jgi:hypothetical protein
LNQTLPSKLQARVAVNESGFPVADCLASRCVVQISRLICVFYFGPEFGGYMSDTTPIEATNL